MSRTLIIIVALLIAVLVVMYLLSTKTAFFTYYLGKGDVRVLTGISYVEGSDNPRQKLDVYLPKDTKDFPMVVFVHGGYWVGGDKNYNEGLTGLYGNIGIALAKRGVGTVVINYRLYPESDIEEQLGDVADAISWTQKYASEYSGNGKIFLMGHSAGGHLVSLLAGDSQRLSQRGINVTNIKGVISFSGIWDTADMIVKNSAQFNEQVSYPLFGKDSGQYARYSPISYIQKLNIPVLLAVGTPDFPYLAEQAVNANRVLISHAVPHTYVVAPGYAHTDMVVKFGKKSDPLLPSVLKFIELRIK